MPTTGLSLVGFIADQQQAINHLRFACCPAVDTDQALIAEWQAARARLGPPIASAGNPNMQPLPAAQDPYMQAMTQAWAQRGVQMWPGATFQLIEIEPLLAYQFHVDTARSAHHCGGLANPPSVDDLMPICLPQNPTPERFQAWPGPQSAMLRSEGLNLVMLDRGVLKTTFMGIVFGPALPFLHVVRHNGRCYLHNGFHRAVGARAAGATHIPCVLRDVPDHASVGIRDDGSTFNATLLESNDPPTIGHFAQGRAHPVLIRSMSRILHVSWADYVIPNE